MSELIEIPRCTLCGKTWGDHYVGSHYTDVYCHEQHGDEDDDPRQYTPAPTAKGESTGGAT